MAMSAVAHNVSRFPCPGAAPADPGSGCCLAEPAPGTGPRVTRGPSVPRQVPQYPKSPLDIGLGNRGAGAVQGRGAAIRRSKDASGGGWKTGVGVPMVFGRHNHPLEYDQSPRRMRETSDFTGPVPAGRLI